MKKKYWLMKSEPEVYSIDDLKKDKTTLWDSIRNYQARNFMTQEMSIGDEILFYHSNAKPPGVAGIAKVAKLAQADPTQFDKKSDYYDEKSSAENPRWHCVEIKYVNKMKNFVSLDTIKATKSLKNMLVVQRGQRLSIQPVSEKDFNEVIKLADS